MPEITKATMTYKRSREKTQKRKRLLFRIVIVCSVLALTLGSVGYYRYTHALPSLSAQISAITYTPPAAQPLAWPAYGQAAVGTKTFGLLSTNGEQTQVPTASNAKLITALAVLESKPLRRDQPGPTITLSTSDVALRDKYAAVGGSVVAVEAGEKITQYQMLQALLLPSANNIADSLVIWAFGSIENYTTYAQQMVDSYGLKHTTIGTDASGLSPSTKSTAGDLVVIAQRALRNPVITQIVAQKQATIPVAGTIRNTNSMLGQDGIVGIKTGNTDEAGGVFLLAGNYELQPGQTTTVIASVMGAPDLRTAMQDSRQLFESAKKNLVFVNIVKAGDNVGIYRTPWGKSYTAVAASAIHGPVWLGGTNQQPKFSFDSVKPPRETGSTVGSITFTRADGVELKSEIRLRQTIEAPSWQWRVFGKD
ncbi:MAG: hypothetical protein WBP26_01160 [Candidatus Saccharimonadales bacterium]